jgi:GT2 family glycosyltransferase
VLVHWNQPERCARTIEAFARQGVATRIVVVDNGSEPGALARLREVVDAAGPSAELIELGRNTGFGPAANVGFRHWLAGDGGEWVALAPHDALPAPGTLATVIAAAAARSRAGLACADVGDGSVPVVDPYFGGMTVPAPGRGPGWESVDYPHGTLLVARRACLLDIGLFDERYFAYCEEAELGVRARAAGWEVGLVRGAMVTNPTMRSGSPAVDYLMHRNTLLLVREVSGRYHAGVRLVIAAWQLLRGLVQPSARPSLFSASGRLLGMVDFLRGRFGPPPAALLLEAGEPAGAGG